MSSAVQTLRQMSDIDVEELVKELETLRKNNDIMKKLLVTIETINDLLKNKSFGCQCKQSLDIKNKTKLNVLNKKYIELKDELKSISDNKLNNKLIVIKTDEHINRSFAEQCVDISNVFSDNQIIDEISESIDKTHDSSHESDGSFTKEDDQQFQTVLDQMDEKGYEYCCEFSDSKTGILCLKKFTTQQTLVSHVLGHSGQKPWFCEYSDCDYRSVLRSHLIGHIRKSHTARHQFQCDWPGCDFRGPSRYNVKRHKIIHTNEKPYKCDWPGCEFRSPNNKIAEHKRIHTGEKPYLCSWVGCEARFSRSFTLRNHLRTHTGEKPFKCHYPDCHYSSSQQTPLATHKRKHHNWSKESSEEVVFSDNIVSTDE